MRLTLNTFNLKIKQTTFRIFSLLFVLILLHQTKDANSQACSVTDKTFAIAVKAQYPACVDVSNNIIPAQAALITDLYISGAITCIKDADIQLFNKLTSFSCKNATFIKTPTFPNSVQTIFLEECPNLTSIPTLPPTLYYLIIQIADNLTTLPSTLPNTVIQLQTYRTSLNQLPTLGTNLTHLNVLSGKLTSLPILPASLKFLDCDNNLITNFDFSTVPNLLSLAISHNSYNTVNLNNLTKLTTLQLGGRLSNAITDYIPPTVTNLEITSAKLDPCLVFPPNLQELRIYGGDIKIFPKIPESVFVLTIHDVINLTSIPNIPSALTTFELWGLNDFKYLQNFKSSKPLYFNIYLCNNLKYLSLDPSLTFSSTPTINNNTGLKYISSLPLNMSSIELIGNTALKYLPQLPDNLTSLNLTGTPNITCLPNKPTGLATSLQICTSPVPDNEQGVLKEIYDNIYVVNKTTDYAPESDYYNSITQTFNYKDNDDCNGVGTFGWAMTKSNLAMTSKNYIVFDFPNNTSQVVFININYKAYIRTKLIYIDGSSVQGYNYSLNPRIQFSCNGGGFFQRLDGIISDNVKMKGIGLLESGGQIRCNNVMEFDHVFFATRTSNAGPLLTGTGPVYFKNCAFGNDHTGSIITSSYTNGVYNNEVKTTTLPFGPKTLFEGCKFYGHYISALGSNNTVSTKENNLINRSYFYNNAKNINYPGYFTDIVGINSNTGLLEGYTNNISTSRVEIYRASGTLNNNVVEYMGYAIIDKNRTTTKNVNGTNVPCYYWTYDPAKADVYNNQTVTNKVLQNNTYYTAVSSTDLTSGEFSPPYLFTCTINALSPTQICKNAAPLALSGSFNSYVLGNGVEKVNASTFQFNPAQINSCGTPVCTVTVANLCGATTTVTVLPIPEPTFTTTNSNCYKDLGGLKLSTPTELGITSTPAFPFAAISNISSNPKTYDYTSLRGGTTFNLSLVRTISTGVTCTTTNNNVKVNLTSAVPVLNSPKGINIPRPCGSDITPANATPTFTNKLKVNLQLTLPADVPTQTFRYSIFNFNKQAFETLPCTNKDALARCQGVALNTFNDLPALALGSYELRTYASENLNLSNTECFNNIPFTVGYLTGKIDNISLNVVMKSIDPLLPADVTTELRQQTGPIPFPSSEYCDITKLYIHSNFSIDGNSVLDATNFSNIITLYKWNGTAYAKVVDADAAGNFDVTALQSAGAIFARYKISSFSTTYGCLGESYFEIAPSFTTRTSLEVIHQSCANVNSGRVNMHLTNSTAKDVKYNLKGTGTSTVNITSDKSIFTNLAPGDYILTARAYNGSYFCKRNTVKILAYNQGSQLYPNLSNNETRLLQEVGTTGQVQNELPYTRTNLTTKFANGQLFNYCSSITAVCSTGYFPVRVVWEKYELVNNVPTNVVVTTTPYTPPGGKPTSKVTVASTPAAAPQYKWVQKFTDVLKPVVGMVASPSYLAVMQSNFTPSTPGKYRIRFFNPICSTGTLPYTEYTAAQLTFDITKPMHNYTICYNWKHGKDIGDPDPSKAPYGSNLGDVAPTAQAIAILEEKALECKKIKLSNAKSITVDCANPNYLNDKLTVGYTESQYHYTLYYYDRAGNLVSTVPPKAVEDYLQTKQAISETTYPDYKLPTNYNYNSLAQLTSQNSPDAGTTNFAYNAVGQLRFSQSDKQADATDPENINSGVANKTRYTYTNYDNLGRPIDTGEEATTTAESGNSFISSFTTKAANNYTPVASVQQTKSVYSTPHDKVTYFGSPQRNLNNRISYSTFANPNNALSSTVYSYDPHGNVEWMVNILPGIGKQYISYEYDLISNKVTKVKVNENRADRFYMRYFYDEDNRITKVESSRDNIIWDTDARYDYYIHGPLRTLKMGHDNLQKMDYTYTLLGWLKGINNPYVTSADFQAEQTASGEKFLPDLYASALNYHKNDFNRSVGGNKIFQDGLEYNTATTTSGTATTNNFTRQLFNGNISGWVQRFAAAPNFYENVLSYQTFIYDKLNRLKEGRYYAPSTTSPPTAGVSPTIISGKNAAMDASNSYFNSYKYDQNGNIKGLTRFSVSGSKFDGLVYSYNTKLEVGVDKLVNNKLRAVTDNGTTLAADGSVDILSQSNADNYVYDKAGNLISDLQDNAKIRWNAYGKVYEVTKTGTTPMQIRYLYDASGNRVVKEVNENPGTGTIPTRLPGGTGTYTANGITYTLAGSGVTMEYYLRDAQGNVMALLGREHYKHPTITGAYIATLYLKDLYIYGSDRIGTVHYAANKVVLAKSDIFALADFDKVAFDLDPILQKCEPFTYASVTSAMIYPKTFNSTTGTFTALPTITDINSGYYPVLTNFNSTTNTIKHVSAGANPVTKSAELFVMERSIYDNSVPPKEKTLKVVTTADNQIVNGNSNGVIVKDYGIVNSGAGNDRDLFGYRDQSLIVPVFGEKNRYSILSPMSETINNYNSINDRGFNESKSVVGMSSLPYPFPFYFVGTNCGTTTAIQDNTKKQVRWYISRVTFPNYWTDENSVSNVYEITLTAQTGNGNLDLKTAGVRGLTANTNIPAFSQVDMTLSSDLNQMYVLNTNFNKPATPTDSKRKGLSLWAINVDGTASTQVTLHSTLSSLFTLPDKTFMELAPGGRFMAISVTTSEAGVSPVTGAVYLVDLFNPTAAPVTLRTTPVAYHLRTSNGYLYADGTAYKVSGFGLVADATKNLADANVIWGKAPVVLDYPLAQPANKTVARATGNKFYEIKDHLGNVHATFNDEMTVTGTGTTATAKATIKGMTDYLPFGMTMPGRNFENVAYKYGYNGKEKDKQGMGGGGSTYDYGFRIYNPQIAKFLSVDPLSKTYPMLTPYQFASNTPIQAVDLDGLEAAVTVVLQRGNESQVQIESYYDLEGKMEQQNLRDRFPEIPQGNNEHVVVLVNEKGKYLDHSSMNEIVVMDNGSFNLEKGLKKLDGLYISLQGTEKFKAGGMGASAKLSLGLVSLTLRGETYGTNENNAGAGGSVEFGFSGWLALSNGKFKNTLDEGLGLDLFGYTYLKDGGVPMAGYSRFNKTNFDASATLGLGRTGLKAEYSYDSDGNSTYRVGPSIGLNINKFQYGGLKSASNSVKGGDSGKLGFRYYTKTVTIPGQ
ncbi:MAG: hypothetical protein H7329_00575 [Opitutaceae bacterium]|nr:hypothetical protein [Cytophagales bacterium]